jgi:hypothetical protein
MSPDLGHGFHADLNTDLGAPAPVAAAVRLMAVGDFDGDGRDELVLCPDLAGTAGNDLWAMEFDGRAWRHMTQIPGHRFAADINPDATRGVDARVKLVAVGDFDGDGRDELALAPDRPGTAGNDLWIMKLSGGTWRHLTPIADHGFLADVNADLGAATPVSFGVRALACGDFDGDGRDELIVVPDVGGTPGNDLWAMKLVGGVWQHMSPIPGHPFLADINCDVGGTSAPTRGIEALVVEDFDGDGRDELVIVPHGGRSELWAMKFVDGAWRHVSPIPGHPFVADVRGEPGPAGAGVRFALAGKLSGDRRAELVVGSDRAGTAGNDLWVLRASRARIFWSEFARTRGLLPG